MLALRIVHKVTTVLILATGLVHTFGTIYFFERLNESAIWFAGAGLAGIFVAFLNMCLWAAPTEPPLRWPTDLANCLFIAWLALGSAAMPGAQAFIVVVVGVLMAISGLLLPRKQSGQ